MDRSMHSLPPTDTPNTRRSINFRSGGSDVCPTCGGTGKVAKGQQEELVALIPYKDERLKPRRTCLIVVIFLLIIVVMVITATLLAIFLSPRNVTVTCGRVVVVNWTNIRPSEDGNSDNDDVRMTLQVHGVVKNDNYPSIKIKSVNVTVSRDEVVVGNAAHGQCSVGGRQHKEIIILLNATYTGAEATKVRTSCETWRTVSLEFTLVSSYQYMTHTSNTDDTTHYYLPCATSVT